MKGFLSLSGITLIVGAMAMILFSFTGNPLEDLKNQERLFTYTEIRENYSNKSSTAPLFSTTLGKGSPLHESSLLYFASGDSCSMPAH